MAKSALLKEAHDARIPHANDAAAAKAKKALGEPAQKSPKWAQQMFVTPWQTKAFSYTQ